MKVVKAIAVREPWASQIAAGATTTAFKSFRTPYRGEILIVSDDEPWYGVALAELSDVQAITREMNAPLQRGYAWVFRNVVQVTRFAAMHRSGLYSVEVPEGALPGELQAPIFAEAPRRLRRTMRRSRSRSPASCGWRAPVSAAPTAACAS